MLPTSSSILHAQPVRTEIAAPDQRGEVPHEHNLRAFLHFAVLMLAARRRRQNRGCRPHSRGIGRRAILTPAMYRKRLTGAACNPATGYAPVPMPTHSFVCDQSIVALRHGSEFYIDAFRFQNKGRHGRIDLPADQRGLRTLTGLLAQRGLRLSRDHADRDLGQTRTAICDRVVPGRLHGRRRRGQSNRSTMDFTAAVCSRRHRHAGQQLRREQCPLNGQYFFVRDLNSIPQPLLIPAGRGWQIDCWAWAKAFAPNAPPAQDPAQQQQQQQPPPQTNDPAAQAVPNKEARKPARAPPCTNRTIRAIVANGTNARHHRCHIFVSCSAVPPPHQFRV